MKPLLNWRYYVLTAICTAGILLMLAACGEPAADAPTDVTLLKTGIFAALATGCFALQIKLCSYWRRHGRIPELTKINNHGG